ncbi:alpha-amylase family protein [Dactylosporangium sp. CS-033363]|uniref:alpha-amylase family protein n=1 Tax=Dactylosporangium sp. CS-033363 TaxID=3239935 RepID=UPI003D9210AB
MGERWYTESVIYCLDVETFQDSNGDGIGDFQGLISRLDYLTRLGVNCLWLSPIHPTPGKDDGYDVTDFYNVDPRLGTLGDFAELLHEAANRGIKVMIDLVVNHTSDEHPWFQSAVSSPDSPYRDWFVWADKEPADRHQGMVFPGEQAETWTYHRKARAWYYHRFYNFQPDLNFTNPQVRTEIKKVLAFWIQLGVAGFRMDAVPFIIELTEPGNPNSPMDFAYLSELRSHVQWRRGDAMLLAEANVEPEKLPEYFGDSGGTGNRIHMLFDFMLNGRLVLALARQNPEPVIEWLRTTPHLPPGGHWATFLRNHDEIDLSRLTAEQRDDVFAEFGPSEDMQLYGRGIRRRLAPMLGNDRSRIELAYSLQFTMRGTPVLRYGEEIGMGEDLSQEGRYAIRTPMQWSFDKHGGFSAADPIRPVISKGEFSYEKVNVTAQRHDDQSLLAWFERMIRTLRESPEVGNGTCSVIDQALPPGVLVHKAEGRTGTMLFLHNLGTDDVVVDLSDLDAEVNHPNDVFADREYPEVGDFSALPLGPYGYRWIRLKRESA